MAQLKRYNGTSWETIGGVVTGDTLPIGSEVDYDGANVPAGWQEVSNYDTGWVDLSSNVNTTNFTIRSGFTPMVRRIGKMVFFKGAVYCSTAPNGKVSSILVAIPSQFRPTAEISGAGFHYNLGPAYKIFYDPDSYSIRVSEESNIPTTSYYQGYSLSDLGPYLVD